MNVPHRILVRSLSLVTAAGLQIMPMIRSVMPALSQDLAPSSGWAIVFRWVAGGASMFGYHAVSRASSIAISPANATVGQPYVGTITYSGGHAGSVSSMSYSGVCLSTSTSFVDGLSIVYSGGNTASVSGTPTAAGTFTFTLQIYDSSTCGRGNADLRSTSLVVGGGGGGGVTPAITSPPEGITTQVGASALLSAGASGNPTPSYYWYRGIPNVSGNLVGTSASLNIPAVQLADAGLYTVVASNASGQATAPAYLSVAVTPGTNQLQLNFTNYAQVGQALTMYSYITNVTTGNNTYKWQFNSVDITPYTTTGNTLHLTAAQVVPSKSGRYSVVFNSVVGSTTVVDQQLYYSYWAFGLPPDISEPPQGTTVSAGSDVILSATATNVSVPAITATLPNYGTNTPLTFQWFHNGSQLLATQVTNGLVANEQLVLNSVSAADEGDYTVVVSNYWGSITSSPAVVSIGGSAVAPSITTQPQSLTVTNGDPASFTVVADGSPAPTYQWRKDGVNVSGATTATFNIASATTNDAGGYDVIVANSSGSVTSMVATLTVVVPVTGSLPTITTQPQSLTVTNGGPASFTVAADGTPPPTYQWRKDGVNLSGATAATYTIASATTNDAGGYDVIAVNSSGSVTSKVATLTVVVPGTSSPPTIIAEPTGVSVLVGQNASFSVTASGTPPLSYQWQRDNTNLIESGVYSGVNTNVLTFTSVGTEDAGIYSVVITNAAGSTNSTGAPLTVASPPPVSLTLGADGLHLDASTLTGLTYIVLTTTNLSSPWTPIATNSVSGSGRVALTNNAAIPEQYFRLEFP